MKSIFDDIEESGKPVSRSELKSRLTRLVPRAFSTLERNLTCGDPKVQVAAAIGILDRTGFGPQSKLTIEDERADLTKLSDAELVAQAAELSKQILEKAKEDERNKFAGPFESEDAANGSKAVH